MTGIAATFALSRPVAAAHASMGDFDPGTRAERARGATSGAAAAPKRASGPDSAPADLLAYICTAPQLEAVRTLGLSKGTIHNLARGYWPSDSRKIMRAWQRYKGSHGVVASGWFLRKVYAGGLVRHAGQAYTATGLAARSGQLLAVSRAADGGLLAQTLDLPAQRVSLAPANIEGLA
jgi:hypothetical protein